jgi:hypothetical protein
MIDIDEVIASAKLPEKTLPLNLRGDLQAEWEDLERQLRVAQENADDDTLAGDPKARKIANRMVAISKEMAEHTVVFRFRALPKTAYSDLLTKHKADENTEHQVDGLDWDTYPTALIAACSVDPKMSVAQADRLSERVTDRQWDDLFATALSCNRDKVDVPFSFSASAIRAATAPRSKQPERGESPAPGSSDESLAG